ncbi:hypothetical protein [Streptomyces sp. NBC_01578]|uniref:hypothetical protein n=1 Tax=Streptomyces sp. NBC_01578 TaxID=2975884 RepID=UPI003863D3E4
MIQTKGLWKQRPGTPFPDSGPYVGRRVDVLSDALLLYFAHEERELLGPLSRFGFCGGQV